MKSLPTPFRAMLPVALVCLVAICGGCPRVATISIDDDMLEPGDDALVMIKLDKQNTSARLAIDLSYPDGKEFFVSPLPRRIKVPKGSTKVAFKVYARVPAPRIAARVPGSGDQAELPVTVGPEPAGDGLARVKTPAASEVPSIRQVPVSDCICEADPVTRGDFTDIAIDLDGAAHAGGQVVRLTYEPASAFVNPPAEIEVPHGTRYYLFDMQTNSLSNAESVKVTAQAYDSTEGNVGSADSCSITLVAP